MHRGDGARPKAAAPPKKRFITAQEKLRKMMAEDEAKEAAKAARRLIKQEQVPEEEKPRKSGCRDTNFPRYLWPGFHTHLPYDHDQKILFQISRRNAL